jgi:hypothetical protein
VISFINYISAKQRLIESQKTVDMMGGEHECQPMILAQRDMIKLERDFYREEFQDFVLKMGVLLLLLLVAYVIAKVFYL